MKNKKIWKIFSFLAVIIFFLAGFFLINNLKGSLNIKSVKIAGQNIKVDLALTEAEQEQGLSGRQSLAANEGMLFVFASPGDYQFWMKDMNFPIDMIWLDQNLKVIYIEKNATPISYPETFGPGPNDGEAKFVLEVPDGFSEKNNLQVGDSAEFR
jgi:uncharacterized membrane protein (UPF0127 family)